MVADLIVFPHVPQELYDDYKTKKGVSVRDLATLKKCLSKLFKESVAGDKLSQLILFDFYLSINHKIVFKDNITGKRIEQRLSKLFALSTGDEIKKVNPNIKTLLTQQEISLFEIDVLNLICSNYRQKGDLFFFDSANNSIYKLSIKSLVPDNNEINLGAFEFQSTIKGISGLEALLNLQERNRQINLDINGAIVSVGIGSSKQMSGIFDYIKHKGKLDEYLLRFETLLKGVFKDDFLVYIKDNAMFRIYIVENKEFINFVLTKVKSGFKNMRYEGNAIRITDLIGFIGKSYAKYEYTFDTAFPNFNEIEELFIKSNTSKLRLFQNFINMATA